MRPTANTHDVKRSPGVLSLTVNDSATPRKARRKPGNVKVFDTHYSDYRRRIKRPSGWKVVGDVEVPKGLRFQVRYVDLSGAQKYESFEKRTDAEARATTLVTELSTGSHIDRRRSETTVGDVATAWKNSLVSKSENTQANYTSMLNNHVLPDWRNREVGSITHGDVAAWVAVLVGKKKGDGTPALSAASVHKAWIVLSGVLDFAVDDGLIRANPAAKVSLPKIVATGDVYLTHVEVDRLARSADYLHSLRANLTRAARDRDAEKTMERNGEGLPIVPNAPASVDGLLIRFASYSGLRVGELSALQVRDVDLDKKLIHVRRANAEVGGRLVPGLPKGDKIRQLDLFPHLVDDMSEHMRGKAPGDPVFTSATGAPLRRGNLNKRVIGPAAELAEIEDVSAHTLRHTFASLCASAGVRIEIVSRWMGHASVAITQRVYVGLFDEDLSASAGLVSAALASARKS